jgi:hypothetical protein
MRITRQDTFEGVPLVNLRAFLRDTRLSEWDADWLAEDFSLTKEEAEALLAKLVDAGYAQPYPHARPPRWINTVKANELANATMLKPMTRAAAERHLAGLLERVAEVNATDEYLYQVRMVVLFGSLLDPEATEFNDVDVAIDLERKPRWDPDSDDYIRAALDRAHGSGRQFPHMVATLSWPEDEIKLRLKNRNSRLSLTTLEDQVLRQTPTKVVFLREGADPRLIPSRLL